MAYIFGVKIVRTKTYEKGLKRLRKLGASANDVAEMEQAIIIDPKGGDVIKDAGGLRKMRFGYASQGKRGGGRTIYYDYTEEAMVIFVTAYPKVDKDDITADERKLFVELIRKLTDDQEE